MAYNEFLGERIGIALKRKGVSFEEKKMMGGLAMMVDEKMCVGVIKDNLMARIDPDIYETALSRDGCKPMDFTGKRMKGFVFVEPEGIDQEEDLEYWLELALEFNPRAKSSKKKK
jgi:TfoX/Sxy family transcriptional regulator of competence genes